MTSKMQISQKRAIWYAQQKKREGRRRAFLLEKEGTLKGFEKSKYKTLYGYIFANYNKRIY